MKAQHKTGYPSIDKPWMKYYSDCSSDIPKGSIYTQLCESNMENMSGKALSYFLTTFSYKELTGYTPSQKSQWVR